MEKIGNDTTNFVLLIGTPKYLEKYNRISGGSQLAENAKDPGVRTEAGLMNFISSYPDKVKIIPLLLEGKEDDAFPLLQGGKLYQDFVHTNHFESILKVVQRVHQVDPKDEAFERYIENFKKKISILKIKNISVQSQQFHEKIQLEKSKEDKAIDDEIENMDILF